MIEFDARLFGSRCRSINDPKEFTKQWQHIIVLPITHSDHEGAEVYHRGVNQTTIRAPKWWEEGANHAHTVLHRKVPRRMVKKWGERPGVAKRFKPRPIGGINVHRHHAYRSWCNKRHCKIDRTEGERKGKGKRKCQRNGRRNHRNNNVCVCIKNGVQKERNVKKYNETSLFHFINNVYWQILLSPSGSAQR